MQIVPRRANPAHQELAQQKEHYGDKHADPDKAQSSWSLD